MTLREIATALVAGMLFIQSGPFARAEAAPAWLARPATRTLAQSIPPPPGHARLPMADGSFGAWLRGLPLRDRGAVVRHFDGATKPRQDGVLAVLDLDVGRRDLQQCADTVIRLRSEYLRAAGCEARIMFRFTSGHPARWTDWREGQRPVVSGNKVTWAPRESPDDSYRSFRRYLDSVFTYAGTASLARELVPVEDPSRVLPGDVFIQGGFPGHAVLVADVAESPAGERVFLLVQGFMPAQDAHVLKNPASDSPWYPARTGTLVTPEWTFSHADLRRFAPRDCGEGEGATPGTR